jgi:16S rRNA (guanine966-N2)-methyltransferase
MRIIAGKAKGTRLKMVPGKHVRPTADRVKESLFQVIGPFFDGGMALDLFAGTGALGLEALSRGLDRAVFIDSSRTSCDVIRMNAGASKLSDSVEVYRNDVQRALPLLKKRRLQFDYIFLDPPYKKNLLAPTIEKISKHGLLKGDGLIVAEHEAECVPPEEIGAFRRYRLLNYRDTSISLYEWGEPSESGSISGKF